MIVGKVVMNLFSGMEIGREAAKDLNWDIDKWYSSEVDKYAIQVAENNHDDLIQLGSVIDWRNWSIDWSKVDVILAGSPCQGFSRAGKGLNFDDERSKLFFEFVDILNHAKQQNPNVKFMLENVHMKKEWREVINDYLGVEYIDINSSLVSAQKRPRLYWTNIEGVDQPKDKNVKLIDILENEVDEKYYILREDEKKLFSYINNELRVRQATKKGYDVANIGDSINLSCPNSKTRRGRVGKSKCNTLDTSCNYAIYLKALGGGWGAKMGLYLAPYGIRKITPIECERLQTLPDDYTYGVSDTQRYKMLGNGWTKDVIKHILSYYK